MKPNNLENTFFQIFNEITNFINTNTFDEKVLVLMIILIKIDSNKTLLLLNLSLMLNCLHYL
jgi:hypothetical protein